MSQKIFGITGWKNSGKTTLTERLVRCLTARGHRISTIKHAHHALTLTMKAPIPGGTERPGQRKWPSFHRTVSLSCTKIWMTVNHRFPRSSQSLALAISFWSKVISASRTRRSKYVAMVGMKGLTFQKPTPAS
ncbi:molybdopterin-guanine dinucleotide biosynthesis protein b [Brucella melitensis bv. 1 str. 16M]|uniref:Molybdopterin-guanine dinucleotide biosynthesis protein b n=1 Tax=Brucella melitensis biotype 1 (strain ATCC 23456 / CCUG 17765 / NCTC 10094 / 16M) TaxID=224914 RepID=Q8YGY4_BRUME|nr:molybdopterin-guanine dinucleotide biosynthesis protein b [Brucella melitensis bv. 1 str. 16M]KFJ62844.1 molybdopterin guanine dinucleotide synthesis B family protein [Brucella abortus bv. 4 str. 292]